MKARWFAPPLQRVDPTHVLEKGQRLIYFGGCDYYRVSWHPAVRTALNRGMQSWGLNVAASRKTTGNHLLYEKLESALANFFRAERAVFVSSGYVASLVVGQALAGQFSHVLLDQRAHACLRDATRFFDCPVLEFEHRSAADLARRIRQCGKGTRPVILTDGLFAHDGSVAPLRAYLDLLPSNGWLVVDDAHGAGVLGPHGRGSLDMEGLNHRRIIQTITLSKAFGVYGGAILGPASLQQRICARSNLLAGNTPLPLPLAEAALTALELCRGNSAWRHHLFENNRRLKEALRPLDLPWVDTPGPILFWPVRQVRHGQALARALRAAGIYPSWIRYPGGPSCGYFRFALSSAHRPAQVDRLANVLLRSQARP